jgi:hypothetical protein
MGFQATKWNVVDTLKTRAGLFQREEAIRIRGRVLKATCSDENEKIREMRLFGWSLHGRQETGWVRHYVELSFIRDSTVPTQDELKTLTADYNVLRFPRGPTLWLIVVITVLMAVATAIDGVVELTPPIELDLNFARDITMLAICILVLRKSVIRRTTNAKTREASASRARELLAEADRVCGKKPQV